MAGTEEQFAVLMTEKAKEIGMENTNFSNSSGINDPYNYSTVSDILIMSNYLIKNFLIIIPTLARKNLLGIELVGIRLLRK